MAFAFVSGSQNAVSAASNPQTCGYAGAGVTAGSLLVCFVSVRGSGVSASSLTDSQGNTWALAVRSILNGAGSRMEIWWAVAGSTGANTVTVNFTGTAGGYVSVYEFTVGSGPPSLDVTNSNVHTTTTSTHSHGSITQSVAGLMVAGLVNDTLSVSWTNATGFNSLAENSSFRSNNEYRISGSPETTDAPDTSSSPVISALAIAAFKEAGGGGGGTVGAAYFWSNAGRVIQ